MTMQVDTMVCEGEHIRTVDSFDTYATEQAASDTDVFIYGVGSSSACLDPVYDIRDDVPGVDYSVMLDGGEMVYHDMLDAFLDELPGHADTDVEAYIEEALSCYDISAETHVVNDLEPATMQYVEEQVVADRFNLKNPVHRVRYLATQLERADDRLRMLSYDHDTGDGQETLERQRQKALLNTGIRTAAPVLVGVSIFPDQPPVGAALIGSSLGVFAYQTGIEGRHLETTFDSVADMLDGADAKDWRD